MPRHFESVHRLSPGSQGGRESLVIAGGYSRWYISWAHGRKIGEPQKQEYGVEREREVEMGILLIEKGERWFVRSNFESLM